MPSEKPSSSSSASKPPSGSSSSSSFREKEKAAAAAAGAGQKPSSSSGSSGSSSRPSGSSSSSSSGGSSSSAPKEVAPNQPAPYISANAWMSFFLFVCLVLVILQGPLGLSGPGVGTSSFGLGIGTGMGGPAGLGGPWGAGQAMGMGIPGCGGFGILPATLMPWCPPQPCVHSPPMLVDPLQPAPEYVYTQPPSSQMGGQGGFAMPGGGAGWSWYSDQQGAIHHRPAVPVRRSPSVQYQRPGMQLQVKSPGMQVQRTQPPVRVHVQQSQPVQPMRAVPLQPAPPIAPGPAAMAGLANLENAFYPLLVAAIALLVIFDYAS